MLIKLEEINLFSVLLGDHWCDQTMTRSDLVRRGFILLMLPYQSSSLKEVRVGTPSGQEPGGRT